MNLLKKTRKFLKTYLPFTRAGIQMATAYRSNFIAWFAGELMYCFVMYYVWRAVFNSSGSGTFSGFTLIDMTVFLFATAITNNITGSDGSYDVGEEIKDGNIAMRLIKPVSFNSTFLFTELGWKILSASLLFVPIMTGIEVYKYFACGKIMFNAAAFALYLLSLLLSYLFSFYMNLCFGFMAFFLKNLWGFNMLKTSILKFLSGAVIPLAFMPAALQKTLEWLPFASLSYTPVMIYMNKYTGAETVLRLGMQTVWVIFFYLLSRIILSAAMRHVTVQGG